MLLLAGRLEAAGLDQRKVPRDLLPGRALAGARLACGPQTMPRSRACHRDRIAARWQSRPARYVQTRECGNPHLPAL